MASWLQELLPQEGMRVVSRTQELAPEAKQSAVIALCTRQSSAQAVAYEYGVCEGSLGNPPITGPKRQRRNSSVALEMMPNALYASLKKCSRYFLFSADISSCRAVSQS